MTYLVQVLSIDKILIIHDVLRDKILIFTSDNINYSFVSISFRSKSIHFFTSMFLITVPNISAMSENI